MKTLLLSLAITVLLSACGLWVATDYDTNVAFDQLHRFQWLPHTPEANEDPRLYNDLMNERMQRIISAELVARGYTIAGEPDMWVTYHLMQESREAYYGPTFGGGFGYGGDHSAVMVGGTYSSSYDETQIIIDILDGKTRRLLWRGSAKQPHINNSDPAALDGEVTYVVQEILARFPPPGPN